MDGVDRLLAELTAWSAEQRSEDAARSRSAERSLRQQAIEEATFAGALLDVAETGGGVAVQVHGGRQYRGAAVGVGRDFVAVRTDGGRLTLIAFTAIAAVRASGARAAASGSRQPGPRSLVQLLDLCAVDRPRVQVIAAGETVTGELVGVGADVLSIQRADPPSHSERSVAYVPAGSVSEVSLG